MIFFQLSVISWHLITSLSLLPSYWLCCLLLIEGWLFFQNYNKVHKLWKTEEISLLLSLPPDYLVLSRVTYLPYWSTSNITNRYVLLLKTYIMKNNSHKAQCLTQTRLHKWKLGSWTSFLLVTPLPSMLLLLSHFSRVWLCATP